MESCQAKRDALAGVDRKAAEQAIRDAADDLPLLDALFVGEAPRADLATLIAARPPGGYDSFDAVRGVLGNEASRSEEHTSELQSR